MSEINGPSDGGQKGQLWNVKHSRRGGGGEQDSSLAGQQPGNKSLVASKTRMETEAQNGAGRTPKHTLQLQNCLG